MSDELKTDKPASPNKPPFVPSSYQAHLAEAAKDAGLTGPDAHRAIVDAEKCNALRLAESHVAQAVQVAGYDHDQAAGVLTALEDRIAEAKAAKSPLAEAAIVRMAREAHDGLGVEVPEWAGGRPKAKAKAEPAPITG